METDYSKIGLKAGLEVHQQLDTGKLFCRCPSQLREDKPDIVFERKLRAVASELGEFDAAALEAFKKDISFEYQAYSNTNCLLETDEEPPQPCDREALETTLKVALMAKANILDELVVMRKAVVDGSNTSAFQRTMLAAVGGQIKLAGKKVGVQSIALEEDAARPMEKKEGRIVYRLDRLGIPLIELATAPDLSTPEEVKECAIKIGEIFRRTCKAKRGLGTIRQDLNVSIAKGARVEIKGVQALEMMDEYVKREVQRQVSLVEIMESLSGKNVSLKPVDASSVFKNSECKFLKGKQVFAAKAGGMAGLIGKELQQGRRFGSELADYVRARAGLKGLLHSDELPAYGISDAEVNGIKKLLGNGSKDAFILVQAEKENAENAFKVIEERIGQAGKGIPEETRNVLEDGNTVYSRPLPGAARMYPETDLAEIAVEQGYLKELSKRLPLTIEQRKKLYKSKGLSEKLVQKMVLSNSACLFEKLLKKGINATTAATLMLETSVQLKREGINVSNAMLSGLLIAEKQGKVTKDIFGDVLRAWAKNNTQEIEDVIKSLGMEKAGKGEAEKVIARIVQENKAIIKENGARAIGALMGDVMKQLKGRVSGKEASALLRKEIAKIK